MKLLKKIILLILILLLITVVYSKYVKQDPVVKIFGNAFMIVATGSMEPTILPEELIIINEKENYKKGDIVTYLDEDGFLITHRIIEIDSNTFISKGDANNIKDELCDIDRIEGKVVFHSKILGFFILYLLKPICILYAISIVVIELFKINKKGDCKNEKEI